MGNCRSRGERDSNEIDSNEIDSNKIQEQIALIIGKIPESVKLKDVIELQSITYLRSKGRICTGKIYSPFLLHHVKQTYEPMADGKINIAKKFMHELEQFKTETLQHSNIIGFVGVYERFGYDVPTLVTEEVFSNLLKYLESIEYLEEVEKYRIISGICSGLTYLHENVKLAHLNLTTKSILMTPKKVVKISGFEYAKYFDSSEPANHHSLIEFRDEKSTFDFLPQNFFKCTDGSADVFSFACVVLNVYCLEWPIPDPATESTEVSRREKYLLRIESSADIYSVVQHCLSDQRPPIKNIFDQLQSITARSTSTADVTTHSPGLSKLETQNSERQHGENETACSPDTSEHSPKLLEANIHAETKETQNEEVQQEKSTLTQQENTKPESEFNDRPADAGQKKEHCKTDLEVDKAIPERQNKNEQYEQEYDSEPRNYSSKSKISPPVFDSKEQDQLQYKTDNEVEKKQLKGKEQHDKVKSQKELYQEKINTFSSKFQKKSQELQDKLKAIQEKLEKCQRKLELCQQLQEDLDKSKQSEKEYWRKLIECQEELKKCHVALTRHEEDSFNYTNAFTTADEGSVMKLKDVYRHMQHNNRTEAGRAHRKLYREAPLQLADHGMIAYNKAKEIVFETLTTHINKLLGGLQLLPDVNPVLSQPQNEIVKHYSTLVALNLPEEKGQTTNVKLDNQKAKELAQQGFLSHVNKSLYQLQPVSTNTPPPQSDKNMKQYMKLIDSIHDELLEDAKHKIKQTLISEYQKLTNGAPKDIPKQVEDYYSTLAKFTWDCVARTIPIVMSTEIAIYDEEIHELKDKDEDEDYQGQEVTYIYPVLFTSNRWPREVAWKGSVKISKPVCT